MDNTIKRIIALVLTVVLTFSVVTFIRNDTFTASAASASSISIKKSPTLKAGTIKTTSVKLSWTTTKNASSYKLYKSTDKKTWKSVATTKATSYTAGKLTAGTKYYFRLVAISGKTKSPYSNTVAVTPKPERVGSLKIKFSSNTQASVSWNKISGATGYEVFLSTSSDFKKDLKKYTVKGGDKTSYTIKNMKNGKTYYVKVRAVKQAGKKTVAGTRSYKCQLITKSKTCYNYVSQTVYATADVNIRKGAGTSYDKAGLLKKGKSITRTAIGSNGWSKVSYKGTTAYISSKYLTTKKPEATATKANKPVAKTDGGIELYPITSSTAKKIQASWRSCILFDNYEGTSADGKTIVVYINGTNGWSGKDIDGTQYDTYGKIKICEYCGKQMGEKNGMCDGNCAVIFH
ncbi:MAG: fibronectin type III domain-containing protein [Acutalibacteraceae bacterium]